MKYYLYVMLAFACILTFADCDSPITIDKVAITLHKASTPNEHQKNAGRSIFIDPYESTNHPEGSKVTFENIKVSKVLKEPFTYQQAVAGSRDVADDMGVITYQSNDSSIATVDNKGLVTFVTREEGTVTITATKASTPASGYRKSTASYTLTLTKFQPQDKEELVSEIKKAMQEHGNAVNLNYIDNSSITDMSNIFSSDRAGFGFSNFNGNISGWNVSSVEYMDSMFSGATAFNGDISGWNVSNVTDMSSMFYGATAFNGDISGWNVSNVTDMSSMFYGATAFNGNISGWNVSNVTDMSSMFYGATAFNGNISGWNVSNVTDMSSMFSGATAFNGNISGWNVSNVTDMSSMFYGATDFNTNLNSWANKINLAIKNNSWENAEVMFFDSGLESSLPSWCTTEQQCRSSVVE